MDTTQASADTQETNVLADDQAANKFQGFATKDGERVEPPAAGPANDRPAKGGDASAKAKDEGEADEGDDEAKRHKSAQARINKAVGAQRAAERRAASLEQRLAALETRAAAPQQGNDKAKPKSDPNAPQPADYEYGELDSKFIRDLARYEARQEFEAARQETKQQSDNASQTKAQQEFQARLDTFYQGGIDIADDFEEVVSDQSLKISSVLGELILESEFGAQIAYAMASDSKEAKAVSALSPARQAAWFGQREAELSSESSDAAENSGQQRPPSTSSPKTTQAPPPPKGKTRGSGEAQQASPATTDFAQFERLAMKQQE